MNDIGKEGKKCSKIRIRIMRYRNSFEWKPWYLHHTHYNRVVNSGCAIITTSIAIRPDLHSKRLHPQRMLLLVWKGISGNRAGHSYSQYRIQSYYTLKNNKYLKPGIIYGYIAFQ
ncbi:hypothetical protein SAMN04487894_1206 [Niabella drilacis]|uniref:Uncharacterized protein n=1 Tax=Niabella drilacis (strain DSM 25811 / CCM 8410 / CCUG 62505 / LMG 26954 / E90) TaxID=1285928 RepID=A0A1G6ZXL0_NIADE|nr:hypothetical protein SAMN04487894_1206 [Niabella drilacis]